MKDVVKMLSYRDELRTIVEKAALRVSYLHDESYTFWIKLKIHSPILEGCRSIKRTNLCITSAKTTQRETR